jgi:alpha-glucuronidase
METTVKKQNGIWYLAGNRQPSFADLVRSLESMGKGPDLDRYVIGLHFTSESGNEEYQTHTVYAEDPNRAVWLAQMEAAETYSLQYETQHGGAYDSVKFGEDEDHTHWLDNVYFKAAFVSCDAIGGQSVKLYDLEVVEFWGCENGEHI